MHNPPRTFPLSPEARGWGERTGTLEAGWHDGAEQLTTHAIDGAAWSRRDLRGVFAAWLHELWRRDRGLATPRHRAAAALDRRLGVFANAHRRSGVAGLQRHQTHRAGRTASARHSRSHCRTIRTAGRTVRDRVGDRRHL